MDEVEGVPLSNAEFVARLRRGAARDDAERAAYWRAASLERHAEVLVELLDLADAIVRSRGRRVEKPPLPAERCPWPSLRKQDG
ncbi:MAG: hypothetical protein ACKVVT_13480 [Dehalococcoidia bacterium]